MWLFGAVSAMVGCLVLLGGVGEDVVSHNGGYRSDPVHLSWFVAHRNVLDVDAAKLLALTGSVGVLLAVAALSTVVFMALLVFPWVTSTAEPVAVVKMRDGWRRSLWPIVDGTGRVCAGAARRPSGVVG
jgi:hypothetical protein